MLLFSCDLIVASCGVIFPFAEGFFGSVSENNYYSQLNKFYNQIYLLPNTSFLSSSGVSLSDKCAAVAFWLVVNFPAVIF